MSLKIKGLVLSEDQITVINELKELEIFILDKINTIQNHRYLEVNPRWLATGKTDIEKGFMSLTKSIASGSTKTDGN
jgi:hypothetical protein